MKNLFNVLRVLLFFPVLYFLFHEVQLQQILVATQHANWILLFAALLFYILRYILQGMRWHNAALAHGVHHPAWVFVKTQIEIAFLEMVLPIPDSEDALRIIKLRALSVDAAKSAAVTLFDRIMGVLFLLMLLPFTGWLMAGIVFKQTHINYLFVIAGCIPLFVFALGYRKIIVLVLKVIGKFIKLNHSFFENLKQSMAQKISFRFRFYGLLWAMLYGLAGASCAWLLVYSVGTKVSFVSLLLCIPFFYISQTFPLSYQGLGLYEATLVFILQQMGVSNEQAVVTGTLHFLFHAFVILIGGGIFVLNPSKTDFPKLNFSSNKQ